VVPVEGFLQNTLVEGEPREFTVDEPVRGRKIDLGELNLLRAGHGCLWLRTTMRKG
jgi:hypothetical protein